jgi:hypothetical protein
VQYGAVQHDGAMHNAHNYYYVKWSKFVHLAKFYTALCFAVYSAKFVQVKICTPLYPRGNSAKIDQCKNCTARPEIGCCAKFVQLSPSGSLVAQKVNKSR